MRRDEDLIEQINALWLPVYPFIADHLLSASGLGSGEALDFGPFAGGIAVSLIAKNSQFRAKVVDESDRVLRSAAQWAREKGCSARLAIQQVSIEKIFEPDESFDLVTVRGAFFFLTPSLLRDVKRVLRPGGFGWGRLWAFDSNRGDRASGGSFAANERGTRQAKNDRREMQGTPGQHGTRSMRQDFHGGWALDRGDGLKLSGMT